MPRGDSQSVTGAVCDDGCAIELSLPKMMKLMAMMSRGGRVVGVMKVVMEMMEMMEMMGVAVLCIDS